MGAPRTLLPAAAILLAAACTGDIGDGDEPTEPTGPIATGTEVSIGPAFGRRLTREEVFNSIDVVLGVDLDPGAFDLPRDERVPGGFRNSAADQLLSLGRVEAYGEIAKAAVEAADWNALLGEHASCTDATVDCYRGFVDSMGRLVMRRPVPEQEAQMLVELFHLAADEGDDFLAGAQLATRSMLQSPRFIYRLETQTPEGADETRTVDAYELATRLSFLVWNAAPDTALLELAAQGDLPANIDAQLDRLYQSPRARRAMRQYVEQWLYLDAIPASFALGDDLKEQTYRLFEWIAFDESRDLMEAFTSQRAELTGELAEFYGLPSQGPDLAVYDLSDLPERVGFLTHASVMAARTVNPDSSMIDRGLFVLNDVFCDGVPPPTDPDLQDEIEAVKVPEGSGLSQRERFAIQSEHELCASCHGKFDPLGLPFEVFGSAGQHITEDQWGNPLTGQASVALYDIEGDFDTVGEFVTALSQSEHVARCLAEKSMQHAYGRKLSAKDRDGIEAAHALFVEGGGTYRALLNAVAHADDFALVEVRP